MLYLSVLINILPLVISLPSTLNIPKRQKNMRHSRPLPSPQPQNTNIVQQKGMDLLKVCIRNFANGTNHRVTVRIKRWDPCDIV